MKSPSSQTREPMKPSLSKKGKKIMLADEFEELLRWVQLNAYDEEMRIYNVDYTRNYFKDFKLTHGQMLRIKEQIEYQEAMNKAE